MASTSEKTPPVRPIALQPIVPIPSAVTLLVNHVHPLLLLSNLYINYPALIADPVNTLYTSLLPLAASQLSYLALCLPPTQRAPTNTSPTTGTSKSPSNKKVISSQAPPPPVSASLFTRLTTAVLSLLLTLLLATPALSIVSILFGAPFTTHISQTVLFSAHVALLAAFPLIYAHGVDSERWRGIVSLAVPVDEVFGGSLGAVLGAWLGAVPIPLDW